MTSLPKRAKIILYTGDMSVAVQLYLFDLGYVWDDDSDVIDRSAFPYLYINGPKMLWDADGELFFQMDIPELIPQYNAALEIVRLSLKAQGNSQKTQGK